MENTNNTKEIKYIPMYKSYIDAVAKLNDIDRLAIYEAIFNYGFTGEEPKFDNPYLEMGWNLVKPNLVNNINNAIKNQENGKKGGRPKKSNEVNNITSNIQTENKAPETTISTQPIPEVQVEEKVSEIEANEGIDICMDGIITYDDETEEDYILPSTNSYDDINDLKEILSSDYPMSSDIERKLTIIFKNLLDDFEIKNMVKEIKKSKITSDTIEDFISKKIYKLN